VAASMSDCQIVGRRVWRLARDGKGMTCPKCRAVQAMGAEARSEARRECSELQVKQVRCLSHEQRQLAVRRSVQRVDSTFSSPPEVR
jgi:hypothetical protein